MLECALSTDAIYASVHYVKSCRHTKGKGEGSMIDDASSVGAKIVNQADIMSPESLMQKHTMSHAESA